MTEPIKKKMVRGLWMAKVLRLYGWSFEDEEEEKVVDGSHEFYEEG